MRGSSSEWNMISIAARAGIVTILSILVSVILSALVLHLLGSRLEGPGLLASILCPLLISFPVGFYLSLRNQRIEKLYAELLLKNAELDEAQRLIRHTSLRDRITGMLNREAFLDALDQAILASDGGLILIDADNFRSMNSRYGYAYGDDILLHIADAINQSTRKSDLTGRIGGEEFAIFVPLADNAQLRVISDRIRIAIDRSHYDLREHRPTELSVSIGVALCRQGCDLHEVLVEADQNLHEAKDALRMRLVGSIPA